MGAVSIPVEFPSEMWSGLYPSGKILKEIGIFPEKRICSGVSFFITGHFKFRLLTRLRDYVSLDELLTSLARRIINRGLETSMVEALKGARYKWDGATVVYRYDAKKKVFVLLTIFFPHGKRKRRCG